MAGLAAFTDYGTIGLDARLETGLDVGGSACFGATGVIAGAKGLITFSNFFGTACGEVGSYVYTICAFIFPLLPIWSVYRRFFSSARAAFLPS